VELRRRGEEEGKEKEGKKIEEGEINNKIDG
jgi:hypothetical protein